MSSLNSCEEPLDCATFLDTLAAEYCKGCGMRRIPPDYADRIRQEDAREMASDLEKARNANPELAAADAKKAKVLFPRVKNGGKR